MYMQPGGSTRKPADQGLFMNFLMQLLSNQAPIRYRTDPTRQTSRSTVAPNNDWFYTATDQGPGAWGDLQKILDERRTYGGR